MILNCWGLLEEIVRVQSRDKYSVTIKDCLKVLNRTTYPAKNKIEFVKRVVFNYLIGNTDLHAKNFSIFLERDEIKLTPAYDLLCSGIYDCNQRIAMRIGKTKYYKDVTERDWQLFAEDMDISYKIVESELARQRGIIRDAIKQAADGLNSDIVDRLLNYVTNT